MTFKPRIWYPIAAVLAALNVVSTWFAAAAAEPWHATIHAALGVAFGLWAQRLRERRLNQDAQARLEGSYEPLALEVDQLRQELAETQERLDFTERILARGRDPRGAGPAE